MFFKGSPTLSNSFGNKFFLITRFIEILTQQYLPPRRFLGDQKPYYISKTQEN